jgi:hypothetical protein
MKFLLLLTLIISSTVFAQSDWSRYRQIKKKNSKKQRVFKKRFKKIKKPDTMAIEFSSAFRTHHFSDVNADLYKNKVSADGKTIDNPLYSVTMLWELSPISYSSLSLYGGEDSIGSPMYGFMTSAGLGSINSTSFQFGGILGAYFYDESAWEDRFEGRDIQTPSWLYVTYGSRFKGVNVIVGIEFNGQIQISESSYIKIKNVITPLITISSFGIGFNY